MMRRICTGLLLVVAGCQGTPSSQQEPPENQLLRFLRVEDWQLGCLLPDNSEPIGKVFFDQASWADFWGRYNQCGDEVPGQADPVPLPVPTYSWWDRYAMVGVIDKGNCAYSGCLDRVYPLVRGLSFQDGHVLVGMSRPTRDDRGPCEACLQLRDFFLIDRGIAEKYSINFDFDSLDIPHSYCGTYPHDADAGP